MQNLEHLSRPMIDRFRFAGDAETWPSFQEDMTRILLRLDPETSFRPIFHITDEPVLNAFTFADENGQQHIAFTKKMIEFFENEDQLAFVLGHELGHPTFQKKYRPKFNERTQENYADLHSIDMMIASGYQGEQGAVFFERLHAAVVQKYREKHKDADSNEVDRNSFLDPHSPLSSRVEAIRAHIHGNWEQAGRYPEPHPLHPVSEATLRHHAVAVHRSTWDLTKKEQGFDALAPEAKLALIRAHIEQPNAHLRHAALKELPKIGLDPQNAAHVASIDSLADYYLNIRSTNPQEAGQTAPDQDLFYKQALGALGLQSGPLGGLKDLQAGFAALGAARDPEAVKAAAAQVGAAWKEVEQCFKAEEKDERLSLELAGFQAFPKPELVDGAIPLPAPWEPVLEVLRATRGEPEAHAAVFQAALLTGLLCDRRFQEYGEGEMKQGAVIRHSSEVFQAMQRIQPEKPEFPELYAGEKPLRAGTFFKRREALRRLVPLEEVASFRDLENYLNARPSLFSVPVAKGKAEATPERVAAHQQVVAALGRISAALPADAPEEAREEFQDQALAFFSENLRGQGRTAFDLRGDHGPEYRAAQQPYIDFVMSPESPFDTEHRLQFLRFLRYNAARPGEGAKFLSLLGRELPPRFAEALAEGLPDAARPLLPGKGPAAPESPVEDLLAVLESTATTAAIAEEALHAELTDPATAPASPYAPQVDGVLKAFGRLSMQNPTGRSVASPRLLQDLDQRFRAFEARRQGSPEGRLAEVGPERFLAQVRRLDGVGLLADKPHLQEKMGTAALETIAAQPSFAARHGLYLSMLQGNSVADPRLSGGLIKGWAENLRGHLGLDTHPRFVDRIRPFLFQVRHEGNRKELFEELAVAVEAQEATCKIIRDHLEFSRGEVYPLGLAINGVDELVGLCDRNPRVRSATLDFFTNRYSGAATHRYAGVLLQEGGLDPLAKMAGHVGLGGGKLTAKDVMGVAHLPLASLHKRFWALPISARAVLLSNIIVGPPTKVDHAKSEAAFNRATEQILSQVFPGGSPEALASRDLLRAFHRACRSDTERGVVLGALMAGEQRSHGVSRRSAGEVLAGVLQDMGPAYVKLGQAIESHPLTPASIKGALVGLKANVDRPPRWEIWEQINRAAGGLKGRIVHLGKALGAASVNVAMEATFDNQGGAVDPQAGDSFSGVLLLQRPRALARAAVGFVQMGRTVEKVEHPILRAHQGELREMVGEAQGLIREELGNAAEKKEQAANFRSLYAARQVAAQGVTFTFDAVRIPAVGDEFMVQEKAEGIHFKDLPSGPYKEALAEAYYKFEMENILAGKAFDYDRHGKQCKVDVATDRVKLFDIGGMARKDPAPEQLEQLGRFFGRLARANVKAVFTGQAEDLSLQILNESIAKEKKAGNSPDLLTRLRKASLNIGDFYNEIPEARRNAIGLELLAGKTVHPVVAEKIDQGFFHGRLVLQKLAALRGWWERSVENPADRAPIPRPVLPGAKAELRRAPFLRSATPEAAPEQPPVRQRPKPPGEAGPAGLFQLSLS
ncbi:MAG: M48 family metallopeptidase [Verrucomicrobium sp.]|nr:M48 family metallopeptidase [Verrucomicrobium sp.]